MTSAFDDRIVQLGIEIEGKLTTFEGLNIVATGRKYTTAIMNECEARIYNLTRDQKNYILSQASPNKPQRTPIKMTLDVGRQSYGTFRLFEGDVISCGASQPPDIGIILRSLTNNYFMSQVAGYSQAPLSQLSQVAQMIADSNSLQLVFKATDKQISNYSFTGAAAKQVAKLGEIGGVNAYVDNNKLVVLDIGQSVSPEIRLINAQNGMVGIPEPTQYGVRVKMMIDNSIQCFGMVQVESIINPAANGKYFVTQLNFEIANREQPFWYVLECTSPANFIGGTQ